MEIPREFYKLSELAQKKWILTEDEILHIAAAGKLRLSVYWSGNYWLGEKIDNPPLNQYVFIHPHHAKDLLAGWCQEIDGGTELCDVITIDGKEISLVRAPSKKLDENYDDIKNDDIKTRSNTFIPPIFPREKILILLDEVKRYEDLHPKITKPADLEKEKNQLNTPQETKRQNTLLKIIGGFLVINYLSGKHASIYTHENGRPNAKAIADKFLQDLSIADFDHNGIKERTIRDIIPEAFEEILQNKVID
jgi:hypothetical protein